MLDRRRTDLILRRQPLRFWPILALTSWLSFPAIVHSQAQPSSGADAGQPGQGVEAMEEIVVTGQRSINALIREGENLTEDFYMRLNEVLDNDDFRIRCDTERRIGSNITDRVCRTGFQRRLERYDSAAAVQELTNLQNQAALQESLGESGGGAVPQIASTFGAEALRWQAEFQQAILIAVNSDPVLNQQVNRLLDLKSAIEGYQTPRELRREERRAERESERAEEED